jgi:predicted aldo/keto reductase-like oxidoreductase
MNRMEQLEQNVRTAKAFDPGSDDFDAMCAGLDRLRATLGDRFCTMCRYCQPCPFVRCLIIISI